MSNSNAPLAHAPQYAAMGIPIIALAPGTKIPFKEMEGWQHGGIATTDPTQIEKWNSQFPNANYALCAFAVEDGNCFLEFDQGKLSEICEKYGQPLPRTRVHVSGNGGKHFIFKQTPESIALGNRSAVKDGREWFSFRCNNKYLVAPGSVHPNGNIYRVFSGLDIEPTPIPAWLVRAIDELAEKPKPQPKGSVEVHEAFDFDDLMEFHDINIVGVKDDVWHICAECPGVDRRHEQSVLTGFYYDGSSFGWSCFAAGCPLNGKSIGEVIKFLNDKKGEPYKGIIWSDPNEIDWDKFGVEILDADEVVQEESVSSSVTTVSAVPFAGDQPSTVQTLPAPVCDQADFDQLVAERAEQLNPTPLPVPDDIDSIVNAPKAEGLAFDMRAMYGKAGEIARSTTLPLGWTYPGVLAVASALNIKDRDGYVRSNIYCVNIAPVGTAKTVVAEAIEKSIFVPLNRTTYTTPASDRGLCKMIGKDGNTLLLVEDEMRAVFGKCQIPNSTLAQTFCKLWSKDSAGVADKKGADSCNGKLCVLGNIACEDAADFSKIVGSSTVTGFYDRLLLGYDTTPVKYRPLNIKPSFFTDEMVVRFPTWVWDAKDAWVGENIARRRLGEHALRVALVTAALNGDKEITRDCFFAALRFVEWQERLRGEFRPGLAETKDAECLEAAYAALKAQREHQKKTGEYPKGADLVGHKQEDLWKLINYSKVLSSKNLYRKYGKLVTSVKATLVEDGFIEFVKEVDYDEQSNEKERKKKTPYCMLKKNL
jgi:hypothetical protein